MGITNHEEERAGLRNSISEAVCRAVLESEPFGKYDTHLQPRWREVTSQSQIDGFPLAAFQ